MKLFYAISLSSLIALFASMCSAHIESHEGRIVYHSTCGVSANPVQYEGSSGTTSVRKWWYRDSTTGAELFTQDKAVHASCEQVKVLISTPAEIAEAGRLDSVLALRIWAFVIALSLFLFGWSRSDVVAQKAAEKRQAEWLAERQAEEQAEAERQAEEQVRSRKANADRAARKAARRAAHEGRVAANLARK